LPPSFEEGTKGIAAALRHLGLRPISGRARHSALSAAKWESIKTGRIKASVNLIQAKKVKTDDYER
jgi:hypothetical protein